MFGSNYGWVYIGGGLHLKLVFLITPTLHDPSSLSKVEITLNSICKSIKNYPNGCLQMKIHYWFQSYKLVEVEMAIDHIGPVTVTPTNSGRRIYLFNKGLRIFGGMFLPPFDTLKKCTFAYDMNLKLYR